MTTTATTTEIPFWTSDDPSNWNAAFAYHRPWAEPGPDGYLTLLIPQDEEAFQEWVATYNVPVDVGSLINAYDYRGYWIDSVKDQGIGYAQGSRLPDRWLTPYSTMFSAKSFYARDSCPYHWYGDKLFDDSTDTLMFWASYVPPKNAATDYIEASKIDPRAVAKGLMGDDLDMEAVRLYISGKLKLKIDDQILDAEVTRTIEGASSLTLTLLDDDRKILRSGLLSNKLDMEIDQLWWRLQQVSKQGDELKLTFEPREIAILRLYNEIIPPQQRTDQLTRARFILRLIREVDGIHIPVVIPELNAVQQVEGGASNPTGMGIPDDLPGNNDPLDIFFDPRRGLTVKGEPITKEQIKNTNDVLAEGTAQSASRKVLVCSIMTAIQESAIRNLGGINKGGYSINNGVFQQDSRYWPASGNVGIDAAEFFRRCIRVDRQQPNLTYNDLCQEVQRSGYPDEYGQWKGEAENIVTAYTNEVPKETTDAGGRNTAGLPTVPGGADTGGGTRPSTGGNKDAAYFFWRGIPGQNKADWEKEDSWTCIQRLAGDVNWRAFFVGGTFWYVDDEYLFSRKPLMTITESSVGVDTMDFDYDQQKLVGTITLMARIGRWTAQPGAVVVVQGMGPANGRWLVNEFSRSLFDLKATIILKKPLPELPEPSESNQPGSEPTTTPTTPGAKAPVPPRGVPTTKYKDPFRDISTLYPGRIDNGVDYAGTHGDPIYAIGPATIGYYNPNDSWGATSEPVSGARMAYTFTDGPAQGLTVFLAEYINLAANLKVGDSVDANTVIATLGGSGSAGSYHADGIEIGWASSHSDPNPLANAYGGWTDLGENFSQFMEFVGSSGGKYERSHVGGPLPALWPTW